MKLIQPILAALLLAAPTSLHAEEGVLTEANRVTEVALVSSKTHTNPFMEVELDAVVTRPDGSQLRMPGF